MGVCLNEWMGNYSGGSAYLISMDYMNYYSLPSRAVGAWFVCAKVGMDIF